jgi:hypothetical protein
MQEDDWMSFWFVPASTILHLKCFEVKNNILLEHSTLME